MRQKIPHLLIPISSQRATEGKWKTDKKSKITRISTPYLIYQIVHRNKVNTNSDFENESPTQFTESVPLIWNKKNRSLKKWTEIQLKFMSISYPGIQPIYRDRYFDLVWDILNNY